VFHGNRLDDVTRVFDSVDRPFDRLDHILPLQDVQRLIPAAEQLGHDPSIGGVGGALEGVYLVEIPVNIVQCRQLADEGPVCLDDLPQQVDQVIDAIER